MAFKTIHFFLLLDILLFNYIHVEFLILIELLYFKNHLTFQKAFKNSQICIKICFITHVCQMPVLCYGLWLLSSRDHLLRFGRVIIVFLCRLGGERFLKDIESMLGYRPSKIWVWSWKFIAPFSLMVSQRVTSG